MTPFGAYIHIPFCAKRCDYCAFATWTDRDHLVASYVSAVTREIRDATERGAGPFSSVFVGGGTPSRVPPVLLGEVLDALPMVDDAEVTVECNPDDVSVELLHTYRSHRVNRVSLGVQSLVPHVLAALGRTHDPGNVRRAVEAVRDAGIATFNTDLIYGAVGESLDDWRRTLDATLAFDPPHVSAYALTVEAGTPLASDRTRHPDDDDLADKYCAADAALTSHGLANYEISNWARPAHECKHNLLYWAQGDYLGFGCAAHSHRSGRRWWNLRTPERYVAAIETGRSAEGGFELLDATTRRTEALQLAVRMRDGVPASALPVEELDGLVELRDDRAVLTIAGRLLANEVSLRLRDDENLPRVDQVGVPRMNQTAPVRIHQASPVADELGL